MEWDLEKTWQNSLIKLEIPPIFSFPHEQRPIL